MTYCYEFYQGLAANPDFSSYIPTALVQFEAAAAEWGRATNVSVEHVSQFDGAGCGASVVSGAVDLFVGFQNVGLEYASRPYSSDPIPRPGLQQQGWEPFIQLSLSKFVNFPSEMPDGVTAFRDTALHELGHLLVGLAHEHTWNHPECGNPTSSIDLVNYVDTASIMYYSSCVGWSGVPAELSNGDVAGARALYGPPAAWYVPLVM